MPAKPIFSTLYFLFTPSCGVKRKYKRRQRFCVPHHQHRAEHYRHHPVTAPGTSAVWNYKAIYRFHDEQVGQWSDVVSVTVGS